MRVTLVRALCAATLALAATPALPAGASAAAASVRDPRLQSVDTWAFAIGDGNLTGDVLSRYARYDLVVLDGEGASARQVRALRSAGKLVLAYLDVGTIEPGRSWYPLLRPYRLDFWPDWGEWYADVARGGFRRAITKRVVPRLLRKGFDGLFLDNTDMVERHRHQAAGMRALVRAVAALVHRRHEFVFAQNGEQSIGPELPYLDGWNREDVTRTYDFATRRYVGQPRPEVTAAQAAMRRIAARGLLVLATDYVAASSGAAAAHAVANACAAGALPFLSDISLTRVPPIPPGC